MYNIEKNDKIYVGYYDTWRPKYHIKKLGNEKDLICVLAFGFENKIDVWGNEAINHNSRMSYDYWDGYNRIITPQSYKIDAWIYYNNFIKNKKVKKNYSYWRKNQIYKGTFRRTPVEGISKWRGGPSTKPRRIKQIQAMYANPEYKKFNRGSHKNISDGWWDDWYRSVERNWKSQRKHQWKEKKG